MKIVGWTWYGDHQYKEMFEVGGNYPMSQYDEALKVIADELRSKGYKFSGEYHQNGDYGAPVFDNGEVFQCSQRVWGSIMAAAYPDEIDNSDGFGYTAWAWSAPESMVIPLQKLIATNIAWDTDGEDISLPSEIEIPDGMTDEDEISDFLSDETGFCHFGFELMPNIEGCFNDDDSVS